MAIGIDDPVDSATEIRLIRRVETASCVELADRSVPPTVRAKTNSNQQIPNLYKFLYKSRNVRYSVPMTSSLTSHPGILPTGDARSNLTKIVADFRVRGAAAGVCVFGSHRKPEAAVVPYAVFEALQDEIEELVAQARLRERLAEPDSGLRFTTDEVAAELGIDLD